MLMLNLVVGDSLIFFLLTSDKQAITKEDGLDILMTEVVGNVA
jgi:hypothetical protein